MIAKYRTLRGASRYADWLRANCPEIQSAVPEQLPRDFKYGVRVYLKHTGRTALAAPRPRRKK